VQAIQEIYDLIDKRDLELEVSADNEIVKLFKDFASSEAVKDQPEIVRHCQIEIDLQNFQITDNELHPIFTGTTGEGEYFEYPSLKNYTAEDFSYIVNRVKQTKNPSLKLRYAQFLWLSPVKHDDWATIAIGLYKAWIKELNETVWDMDELRPVHTMQIAIENLLYLSLSFRSKEEQGKVKRLALAIIRKFRFDSKKTSFNINLIRTMLELPGIFKKEDFKRLTAKCMKYALSDSDLHHRIDIFRIAEKTAAKEGLPVAKIEEERGKAYIGLADQRGVDLASVTFIQEALKSFRKLKNKEKIKELELKYKELKQKIQLGSVSHQMDLTEVIKQIDQVTSKLLSETPEQIVSFLIHSKQIFPSYAYLKQLAIERKAEDPMFFFVSTTVSDQFGHTSAHYGDEEEKMHLAVMESLDFHYRTKSVFYLKKIFLKGVQEKKISPVSILGYLKEYSWLGQTISVKYQQDEIEQFNWLELLAPGLNDFFSQLFFYYQNPKNIPNVVMAIDSLTLKVEGILRDICELRNVPSFFQARDAKGRLIMKEKDINTLLYDDLIKETLSEDDLMLCRFLLIDKAGYNLRNKVAHTLIRKANDYRIEYLLLLIVVILKLSKNEYGPLEADQKE
jgi:hypothetical protein